MTGQSAACLQPIFSSEELARAALIAAGAEDIGADAGRKRAQRG